MNLKELTNIKEGKAILTSFANRKRIHKDIPIDINRLYFRLAKLYDDKFNRYAFVQVFRHLETMGYGKLSGSEFTPLQSIKEIGLEALRGETEYVPHTAPTKPEPSTSPQPVATKDSTDLIVVLFKLKGYRCKAEVPRDALDEFERLVNI
jgi:hypothetical protein